MSYPPHINPAPVIVVPHSHNRKVGAAAATYVSQATCPHDCCFRNAGCYGEIDKCAHTTVRINSSPMTNPVAIALEEGRQIGHLTDRLDLRVHVVGDAPTPASASIVAKAMLRYQARTGGVAWTYTHAWRTVPVQCWQGVNVLASCETIAQVRQAAALGYATQLTVAKHISDKRYQLDSIQVLPCPSQTRGITCVKCRLCMRCAHLRKLNLTIGLSAHGNQRATVCNVLARVAEQESLIWNPQPSDFDLPPPRRRRSRKAAAVGGQCEREM